jgi:ribosomal protein S18 acetylase RimI-like enzyme
VGPIIRAAIPGDAAAIKACVVAAFEQYTVRIGKPPGPMLLDFAAEIKAGHVWVAQLRGKIIGVLVQYETDSGFYIDTVAVDPKVQGIGAGKALLQFAEREAIRRDYKSIYLCTNEKMIENQAFYLRIGYAEYDRKYDGGYDRVFYVKDLLG